MTEDKEVVTIGVGDGLNVTAESEAEPTPELQVIDYSEEREMALKELSRFHVSPYEFKYWAVRETVPQTIYQFAFVDEKGKGCTVSVNYQSGEFHHSFMELEDPEGYIKENMQPLDPIPDPQAERIEAQSLIINDYFNSNKNLEETAQEQAKDLSSQRQMIGNLQNELKVNKDFLVVRDRKISEHERTIGKHVKTIEKLKAIGWWTRVFRWKKRIQ